MTISEQELNEFNACAFDDALRAIRALVVGTAKVERDVDGFDIKVSWPTEDGDCEDYILLNE